MLCGMVDTRLYLLFSKLVGVLACWRNNVPNRNIARLLSLVSLGGLHVGSAVFDIGVVACVCDWRNNSCHLLFCD
jgi:hypothetical protein